MKRFLLTTLALGALSGAVAARAASSSPHYHLMADALSAGGGATESSHYASQGHIGAWTAKPARTASAQMAPGPAILGAASQIVRLACQALPALVEEGQSFQLAASAVMDDGTTMALDPAQAAWAIVQGPVVSVDASGLAVAGTVYAGATATIRSTYQGAQGDARVQVLNTNPDDYGRYAKDGLPDDWQVAHFGENNPDAQPGADPDRDGQDNHFEHTAGTRPADRSSFFHLRIERESEEKDLNKLVFGPVFADREYQVEFQSSLGQGLFKPLERFQSEDVGSDRTVVDLEAGDAERYYRVSLRFSAGK